MHFIEEALETNKADVIDMIQSNPSELYNLALGSLDCKQAVQDIFDLFMMAAEVVDEEDPTETYVNDDIYTDLLEQFIYTILSDLSMLAHMCMLQVNDHKLGQMNFPMAGDSAGYVGVRLMLFYLYGYETMDMFLSGDLITSEWDLKKAEVIFDHLPDRVKLSTERIMEKGIMRVFKYNPEV